MARRDRRRGDRRTHGRGGGDDTGGSRSWGPAGESAPRDRAQTVHDFAFGIGIFIVAAIFVVTFVPGVTTPYATGITETEQERAESVARTVVANVSDGPGGTANATRLETLFDHDWGEPELQHRLGLPADASLNMTVREAAPDGEVVEDYRLGSAYRNQSAATVVRVFRVGDQPRRLEVRVW
jgi:hypothetical protein